MSEAHICLSIALHYLQLLDCFTSRRFIRLVTIAFYAIVYSLFTCHIGLTNVCATEVSTTPNYYIVFEESVYFEIIWPQSLMYTFKLRQARDFGTVFTRLHENIELVISDPENGCENLFNDIRGAVVLIRRGECSFLYKSRIAERAGAKAVIIYDNDENNDNSMIDMITDETNRVVHIPAYFLLGKDGAMIIQQLRMIRSDRALINIPINLTGKPHTAAKRPPWTIW